MIAYPSLALVTSILAASVRVPAANRAADRGKGQLPEQFQLPETWAAKLAGKRIAAITYPLDTGPPPELRMTRGGKRYGFHALFHPHSGCFSACRCKRIDRSHRPELASDRIVAHAATHRHHQRRCFRSDLCRAFCRARLSDDDFRRGNRNSD